MGDSPRVDLRKMEEGLNSLFQELHGCCNVTSSPIHVNKWARHKHCEVLSHMQQPGNLHVHVDAHIHLVQLLHTSTSRLHPQFPMQKWSTVCGKNVRTVTYVHVVMLSTYMQFDFAQKQGHLRRQDGDFWSLRLHVRHEVEAGTTQLDRHWSKLLKQLVLKYLYRT